LEGSDDGLTEELSRQLREGNYGHPVRRPGVSADIRTEHHPNASQECYPYANPHGEIVRSTGPHTFLHRANSDVWFYAATVLKLIGSGKPTNTAVCHRHGLQLSAVYVFKVSLDVFLPNDAESHAQKRIVSLFRDRSLALFGQLQGLNLDMACVCCTRSG
jgi:hypothetical protein